MEDTVGKGENAGYQDFLPFAHCFQGFLLQNRLNSGLSSIGFVLDHPDDKVLGSSIWNVDLDQPYL